MLHISYQTHLITVQSLLSSFIFYPHLFLWWICVVKSAEVGSEEIVTEPKPREESEVIIKEVVITVTLNLNVTKFQQTLMKLLLAHPLYSCQEFFELPKDTCFEEPEDARVRAKRSPSLYRQHIIDCMTEFYNSQSTDVPLTTKRGPIVGVRNDPNTATGVSFDAFLGIPYGQIPARFQLATPRNSWTESLVTQTDGPMCPQPDADFSEDCLYINVYTPVEAASTPGLLPVMVYIHGAGFTYHSCSSIQYGPDFLVNQSVILVSMNYRLGAPGFLTLGSKVAPGNLGMHDTLLALQWVQDEISTFGGDPAQVTLFGESSGGVMTQFHYLSPLSTGMFVRVIAQSGSALADWGHYTAEEGRRRALILANKVNCNTSQSDQQILTCLQNANISDIINNQGIEGIISSDDKTAGNLRVFVPVLDSSSISDSPFFNDTLNNLMEQALARGKPMIAGHNLDEGILKFDNDYWKDAEDNLAAFIPYSAQPFLSSEDKVKVSADIKERYFPDTPDLDKVRGLVDLYTDTGFAYPQVAVSKYFANLTYGYLFSYEGSWAPQPSSFTKYRLKGVQHGADTLYLFYKSSSDAQDMSTCSTNLASLQVKDTFVKYWTNFAKTGVPGSDWSTIDKGEYLVLDSTVSTMNVTAFEDRYYSFWANIVNANSTTNSLNSRYVPLSVICLVLSTVLVNF